MSTAAQRSALAALGLMAGAGASRLQRAMQPRQRRPRPRRLLKNGKPKKPTLKKQVKEIHKKLRADQAYHTYKFRGTDSVLCAVNQVSNFEAGQFGTGQLETAMANLRYYDPASPATLVTADASTGAYSRDVHVSSVYHKIYLKNNYQTPAYVTVYGCRVKKDTSNSVSNAYTAAITDQSVSGGASTSPLSFPFEYEDVRSLWDQAKTCRRLLHPGQSLTCTYKSGSFDYHPSLTDLHSLLYQAKNHGFLWVVRVEGDLGHDSAADEQTTLQAGVDIMFERVVKFIYDAGVNLNDFTFANNASASFSNGGVYSSRPVSDNLSYSVS